MKKISAGLATAIILCFLAGAASAASGTDEAGADQRWEALSAQLKDILQKVEEAGEGLETVRADVRYERSIPLLEEKEECGGELVFQKPDRLVLKLGEPRNEDAYSDGSTWWIVSHDDQQVEIYEMVENPRQTREAAFLKFGYGRSARELLKQYEVSLAEERSVEVPATGGQDEAKTVTEFILRFSPREQEAPSRYSWIEVAVREGGWLPVRLRLAENEGRIMHVYRLTDRKVNVDVEEGSFSYTPPEGYTILRPASGGRGSSGQ